VAKECFSWNQLVVELLRNERNFQRMFLWELKYKNKITNKNTAITPPSQILFTQKKPWLNFRESKKNQIEFLKNVKSTLITTDSN